jgi:hypothetical protein
VDTVDRRRLKDKNGKEGNHRNTLHSRCLTNIDVTEVKKQGWMTMDEKSGSVLLLLDLVSSASPMFGHLVLE